MSNEHEAYFDSMPLPHWYAPPTQPTRNASVNPIDQPPAGKLLCPCCQRSLTCLFCESREFVESAPGPGVES